MKVLVLLGQLWLELQVAVGAYAAAGSAATAAVPAATAAVSVATPCAAVAQALEAPVPLLSCAIHVSNIKGLLLYQEGLGRPQYHEK